jgi:hypothetical protein
MREFFQKYGIRMMLVGFSVFALGGVFMVTTNSLWSKSVTIIGLFIYIVSRISVFFTNKK